MAETKGKPCTYVEQRPKKRKYWDEDYVKGLEQQVQALLAVSQLWYTHAEAMDQIFAPSFEKLAMAQQIRLLVSTLEQLNTFFRSKPHRLHMNNDAPKPIVFFHLQYHMAIMIIISSFLRSFASSDTPGINEAESNSSLLVLRSITSAASETIRLCRLYRDKYTFTMAHPII
ncbi:hypothetical protein CGCF413_v007771 [Colletotrichum fructicola]|nr:hypothetical protein CGCF413_v007771 [Colletotrichum fructicola]